MWYWAAKYSIYYSYTTSQNQSLFEFHFETYGTTQMLWISRPFMKTSIQGLNKSEVLLRYSRLCGILLAYVYWCQAVNNAVKYSSDKSPYLIFQGKYKRYKKISRGIKANIFPTCQYVTYWWMNKSSNFHPLSSVVKINHQKIKTISFVHQ